MMALSIGASAPLHRSPLQQSTSHLVMFTERLFCVQFFALQSDDLTHPLAKSSEFGSPEMISPFISSLEQRFQPSGQITGIILSWQSVIPALNRETLVAFQGITWKKYIYKNRIKSLNLEGGHT